MTLISSQKFETLWLSVSFEQTLSLQLTDVQVCRIICILIMSIIRISDFAWLHCQSLEVIFMACEIFSSHSENFCILDTNKNNKLYSKVSRSFELNEHFGKIWKNEKDFKLLYRSQYL